MNVKEIEESPDQPSFQAALSVFAVSLAFLEG
jgi:hypothetical protein